MEDLVVLVGGVILFIIGTDTLYAESQELRPDGRWVTFGHLMTVLGSALFIVALVRGVLTMTGLL